MTDRSELVGSGTVVTGVWNKLLAGAKEAKEPFIRRATKIGKFYRGPDHGFVYEDNSPSFPATVNKAFAYVSIMGAMIYCRNPKRLATASSQQGMALAKVLNGYLNYTPAAYGLKGYSKTACDEALLNGRGILLTEPDQSGRIVTRAIKSMDLLIDPNANYWFEGDFMAIVHRNKPVWKIAQQFGVDVAKELMEKGARSAGAAPDWVGQRYSEAAKNESETKAFGYDAPRYTYLQVLSKMGSGVRGFAGDSGDPYGESEQGPSNFVEIYYEPGSGVILGAGPWKVPFWADENPRLSWPVSFFDPAEDCEDIWPTAPLVPVIGEMEFLDWAYSFAMGKIKATSRSIFVAPSDISSNMEVTLKGNDDVVVVKVDEPDPTKRKDIIKAIEFGDLGTGIQILIQYVESNFEKHTGLVEVLYGMSEKQMRSAAEANVKREFGRLRVDEMIDKAEDWQGEVARKEALAARMLVSPEQMAEIVGPELAQAWGLYQQGDLRRFMAEFEYTVESGSMQRLTPEMRAARAAEILDRLGPTALSTQDFRAFNELAQEYLVSQGVPQPERFVIQPPPPPPPSTPEEPVAPEVMSIQGGEPVMGYPQG